MLICLNTILCEEFLVSDYASVNAAKAWVADQSTLVLDTETSGLPKHKASEVVEISILNMAGDVVFSSLVKPINKVPKEAIDIHGISNEMLEAAPSWADIHDQVISILEKANYILAYNADFDLGMIEKTAGMHGCSVPKSISSNFDCVMKRYTAYKSKKTGKSMKWDKQAKAATELSVTLPGELHRAEADADLCRRIAIALSKLDGRGSKLFLSKNLHYFGMYLLSLAIVFLTQFLDSPSSITPISVVMIAGGAVGLSLFGWLVCRFSSLKNGWIALAVVSFLYIFGG